MTSLINKIELLIKREKTTPEKKQKDDANKSSSEILSELFGAFNADPPKIDEVSVKKAKKSKKKHKKEKKKRSRSSSSSSDSDASDYSSHKHKKRKKSKSKKRKDRDRSPPYRRSRTPVVVKPDPELKIKSEKYHHEPVSVKKIKDETSSSIKREVKREYSDESVCIKSENKDIIDASLIPMPESPRHNLDESDLRFKLDSKKNEDSDKSKGKIQIKNLKFSTVFEETVKKAEEEARKRAEKYEEGEYTDSSSESVKEVIENTQFPKSSDPGGILKKQAADEPKGTDEEKISSKKSSKHADDSHKKDRSKDRDKSHRRSRSKSKRSRSRSASRRHRSSRDRDPRRRSRSRHRSRSPHGSRSRRSRSRGRVRHPSPRHRERGRRSRSCSRSASRRHWSSLDRDPRRRSRSRHRSRSPHGSRSRRSRSRGRVRHPSPKHRERGRRSRSPSGVKLADSEKKRLLEVARRNAINMLKNGAVPAGAAALPPHTRSQVMAAIQSGGKSVDELTDFCKHLSKKEALGELSSVSSGDEDMSENEDTIAFHHPFLVKEKAPIVMNIRGGAPLPIKTSTAVVNKDELRLQFPVSSGSQHREKASEWVPVSPPKKDMQVAKLNSKPTKTDAVAEKPKEPLALPAPPAKTAPAYLTGFTSGSQLASVPTPSALPALPAPGPQAYPPGIEPPKIDVAAIVSQKIAMIRKEQEQNELSTTRGFGWSTTSSLGEFTGSTGAQILTPRELASGTQAWAKKDQLMRANPVEGGMGMHLLQKMGWTPGQGLGKEGTGTLQPLLLEVKLDTRGLQAKEEVSSRLNKGMKNQRQGRGTRGGAAPLVAGGKHPVSLLGEYCSKQKLGPPEYNLCFECGPDHKKNFLFKVKVAGVEYQPAVASANKKQAKADAAQLALQKLGIVT